jgi:DNA-binding TFAR19-related protein (PDSD5 family)
LKQFFVGKAWEVLEAARLQYPKELKCIEEVLLKLISEGKIREKINGEELCSFFHQLGLRVKLETHIQFMEHGKLKSLEEKMKEKE